MICETNENLANSFKRAKFYCSRQFRLTRAKRRRVALHLLETTAPTKLFINKKKVMKNEKTNDSHLGARTTGRVSTQQSTNNGLHSRREEMEIIHSVVDVVLSKTLTR